MNSKNKILNAFQSPWIVSLILFFVYFITNGYTLGWDDQHLEIPLLKHLIDNTFYQGDYYIESLKQNFSTFFYPILARLISVEQIPSTYFMLFLISRYFLFFWVYKLWLWITKDIFKAVCCVLVFILMLRVEEFLYRTFSHQEFALAIIFAGIYYFFKERFLLSALLLGLAANFHGLYSAFPFFYIGLYFLFDIKKHGLKKLIGTCLVFLLASLPFLIWTFGNRFGAQGPMPGGSSSSWLSLFITACPQNFFFPHFPKIPFDKLISNLDVLYFGIRSHLFLASLFILNIFFNKTFRTNKKAVVFCLGGFILLALCFIFTYLYPQRFFIDLNLVRNSQFLLFLLSGYTVILIIEKVENEPLLFGLGFALMFTFLKYGHSIASLSVGIMFSLLVIKHQLTKRKSTYRNLNLILMSLLTGLFAYKIMYTFFQIQFTSSIGIFLIIILSLLIINFFYRQR